MSAFSDLNSNSSQLYMLPLSNLSSSSTNSLSNILKHNQNNRDKPASSSTSINPLYLCSGDQYRQCRRIRNTAIANQQKQNLNQRFVDHDNSSSMYQTTDERPRPRLSRLWRTVRLLQLGLRHRHQTSPYVQQINNSDSTDRRTTTATSLHTFGEHENSFHRADLEIAEPVYNELPATMSVVPQPVFISLLSSDQEDEQETTSVTGQTLCKSLQIFHSFISLFSKYILLRDYLVTKMLFVFLLVKIHL